MREEFVEPLPALKTHATLICGKDRVNCFVVDANMDGFRVAVPGAEQYEGDPHLMLVTGDSIYPVRLILQEAHAGGYSYQLQREFVCNDPEKPKGFLKNFHFHHTGIKCIAAGLALSAVASFWFISSGPQQYQLLCLRTIRRELSGWWPPSTNDKDQVPPGISIDKSLVIKKDDKSNLRNRLDSAEDASCDLRTVSVSMVSPASLSVPALLPKDDTSVEKPGSTKEANTNSSTRSQKTKTASLKNLLDEGRVGRQRLLTPELIPWLFSSTSSTPLDHLKVSDAAFTDIEQFELGLRGMPIETCMEAVESLRRAFKRSNNINNARTVHGFDELRVIRSDDADIYFRTRKGIVEIVRVLPIEYSKAE